MPKTNSSSFFDGQKSPLFQSLSNALKENNIAEIKNKSIELYDLAIKEREKLSEECLCNSNGTLINFTIF